jgi:hypothetical protein
MQKRIWEHPFRVPNQQPPLPEDTDLDDKVWCLLVRVALGGEL